MSTLRNTTEQQYMLVTGFCCEHKRHGWIRAFTKMVHKYRNLAVELKARKSLSRVKLGPDEREVIDQSRTWTEGDVTLMLELRKYDEIGEPQGMKVALHMRTTNPAITAVRLQWGLYSSKPHVYVRHADTVRVPTQKEDFPIQLHITPYQFHTIKCELQCLVVEQNLRTTHIVAEPVRQMATYNAILYSVSTRVLMEQWAYPHPRRGDLFGVPTDLFGSPGSIWWGVWIPQPLDQRFVIHWSRWCVEIDSADIEVEVEFAMVTGLHELVVSKCASYRCHRNGVGLELRMDIPQKHIRGCQNVRVKYTVRLKQVYSAELPDVSDHGSDVLKVLPESPDILDEMSETNWMTAVERPWL